MDWDVKLDGVSIKGKVAAFTIRKGRALFCKELTLELPDYTLYESFDFKSVPEAPRVEVLTDTDSGWFSEGTFFIEEPDVVQNKDRISVPALRGRDISAKLTFPFAKKISKEWPEETTLFDIFEEIIEGAGLEYGEARILINDYTIYPGSYSVSNRYPLEVLQELAGKTDGFLYTDRLGQLWILRDLYHWTAMETTIHGGQIKSLTERVVHPVLGNRIKVGSFSKEGEANCSVSLDMDDTHVACGEGVGAKAVVTHKDGAPVADDYLVYWTTDNAAYAHWENDCTHVSTHRIPAEGQDASSRYIVSTDYPIRQVHSVTEVATGQTKAVKEFKGRSITLSEPLSFTDSSVIIDYETGYATNTLVGGSTGEVEVDVHAVVEAFVRDTATVRIDTQGGQAQEEKDMYVWVVTRKFGTQEIVPSAPFSLDGESKGSTGTDGVLDLGLLAGGEHSVRVQKTGFKDTQNDGLDNDKIIVGAAAAAGGGGGNGGGGGVTEHNELSGIQGGVSGQYYHLTAAQVQQLHTRKHAINSLYDHEAMSGVENEVLILGADKLPKPSGTLISELGGGNALIWAIVFGS